MSTNSISQKKVNVFIFCIFAIAVILAVSSVLYINSCAQKQLEIEQYINQCEELSQQLVEASSYLTDEVRNFVINQELVSLYNYWNEVEVVKTRDTVIVKLEEMDLPEKEMHLLSVAKENSDLNNYTESRAMRLILDTMNVDESRLPDQVTSYVLNVVEKEMTDEEKKNAALKLLFGQQFTFEKDTMMKNVEVFQQTMQHRLNLVLETSRERTTSAMGILFLILGIILGLVLLVLLVFMRMVVHPIQVYSDTLHSTQDRKYPMLYPKGSKETRIFAEMFNELLGKLQEASAAKSIFVSAMSHEIRTPLNTITGYEYLLQDTELTSRQKEYLEYIQIGTKQLLHIVNNILDFSKLEQSKEQIEYIDFNIHKLCDEVYQIFYSSANQKGVFLDLSMEDLKYSYVKGDEVKIRQILINLISNAIKFTSKGGVAITVQIEENFTVDQKETDIQLFLQVKDTGIGIKEEEKSKIFSAFEQADASVSRKYGGTGMGLAITEQLVQLLKGKIQLDSQVGMGSTFTVQLPLQLSRQESVESVDNISIQPLYKGVHVLLVDDNEINQKMEGELLKQYGLIVDYAKNGEEAVIKADKICYDMIFMDLRMSGMDGYTAAQAICREGSSRHSFIIALTADAEKKSVEMAYQAGIKRYLLKPININEIGEVLKDAYKNHYLRDSMSPLLDINSALARLQGNEKLYIELLTVFLRDHSRDFEKLSSVTAGEQSATILNLIHQLKGVSGTLGAVRLQRVLGIAEKQCNNKELLNKVWQIYMETSKVIQEYLSNHEECTRLILAEDGSKANKSHKETESLDEPAIVLLQSSLADGNLSSMDILIEKRKLFLEYLGLENYKQLEYAIQYFDWETALHILRKGE